MIGLLSALALMLLVSPSEANFVQCPGGQCGINQGASDQSDVINGSPDVDDPITGEGGNDLIFGNNSADSIRGDAGNDLLLGGLGADEIFGGFDDDIILPGPDSLNISQHVRGDSGNDSVNVLVGEITACLFINGGAGNDGVNLIGFGPYRATTPFGVPDFEPGHILVVDPITGGRIFVDVSPNGDGSETINGLLAPNPIFLTDAEFIALTNVNDGTDPCPPDFGFF
jgi:Ca2+-binding RTX toxin-like protein